MPARLDTSRTRTGWLWLCLALPLLGASPESAPVDVVRLGGVARSAPIRLSVAELSSASFHLRLFPDASVHVVRDDVVAFGPESYSVVGHADGDDASAVVLAVRRGVLWGVLRTQERSYRIRPDSGPGLYRVEELESGLAAEGRVPIEPQIAPGRGSRRRSDDGSVLDVLVLYTPRARAASGGSAAMESLVQLGVTETNIALERSGVVPKLRLVHVGEIDYQEAGDARGDLELLKRADDGAADVVHELRDVYGADFVQLIVEERDGCGIAYVMGEPQLAFEEWAFSVVERSCIDASYGFAHELGHNFGCDHAPEDPRSEGAFDFSHGYKDMVAGFRTIMAYGPGTRVARFSNPRVTIRGLATGAALQDNARTINQVRGLLANFRPSAPRPRLARPIPGAVLDRENVRFRWSMPFREASFWLVVGSEPGARDIFDSGSLGSARTVRVPVVPQDGRDVFVRLWYRRASVWLYDDYRFRTSREPSARAQR